jgi:hypothetical protein
MSQPMKEERLPARVTKQYLKPVPCGRVTLENNPQIRDRSV